MYPIIDTKETGRQLRRLLGDRGLSARDVQRCLSLGSVQSVYHWLDGRSIPSIDHLYALSGMLGIPIDDMLVGTRCSGWEEADEMRCLR